MKRMYLVCMTVFALALAAQSALSATVVYDTNNGPSGVDGIVVNGIVYNANFVLTPSSFYAIWDPNKDGDYGDSTTGAAPAFLGNQAGAMDASAQIIAALGVTDSRTFSSPACGGSTCTTDSIIVPFETYNDFGTMRTKMYFDRHAQPGVDVNKLSTVGLNGICPVCGWVSLYTTFDQIAAVPVPPAAWLFGSGLLGLFGMARRRERL